MCKVVTAEWLCEGSARQEGSTAAAGQLLCHGIAGNGADCILYRDGSSRHQGCTGAQ